MNRPILDSAQCLKGMSCSPLAELFLILSPLSLFQLLKVGMHQVVLQEVNLNSTGRYKCQITESRPPFHTEQRERDLTVISEY